MGGQKVAIFDVDRTLFDYREMKIHKTTIDAIGKLKENGILVVIASARSFAELSEECISQIGADYYVTANGQSILDSNGRSLFADRFSYEHTLQVLELVQNLDAGLMLKYDECNCVYRKPQQMIEIFANIGESHCPTVYIPNMDYHKKYLPLAFTVRAEQAVIQGICNELERYPNRFRVEPFGNQLVAEIYRPDSNKMVGLTRLMNHLNITAQECVAFGDGPNDIEMLQWAGIGVAMGNAEKNLKQAADRVCGASWENGISEMLKELKLV